MIKKITFLLCSILVFSCSPDTKNQPVEPATEKEPAITKRPEYTLVIHGGAGTIKKEYLSPEKEEAIKVALNEALTMGETILKNGGTSMDAVEATIMKLEDSPHFNAGKGAVFANNGKNELDASFMDGKTQNAGAVAGITIIKNPIRAARAVMEKSEHVMLAREGAEEFAREQGLEIVDPDYFYTQSRWESLQKAKAKVQGALVVENPIDNKFGTVGCAALDRYGNLAAGTSTGGMTNKRYDRVGDSPIIGAGIYANNNTCAISSTGHGEYFIRYVVAHDISAMMEYGGLDFQTAADVVINKKLKEAGGTGGIIGVDKYGNVAMPFNTDGMYRGYVKPGERVVKFYKE
ncbi:MAG: beta-aspartyl-peptidase (threonine type) [Saprospiraceae bacterium]|jgi:beta-aspartyl-peptidase (threonine type)